jgi:hypothetical protein
MKFEWTILLGNNNTQNKTVRCKVLGGWIVRSIFVDEDFGVSQSMVFIPDANHEWVVDKE